MAVKITYIYPESLDQGQFIAVHIITSGRIFQIENKKLEMNPKFGRF